MPEQGQKRGVKTKLSLEALEVLDAIDRTGTFAAAAELLHRVPSAVTYLVQKLEADLAVTLFERTRRRATLTHAGRVVVEEGRRLLYAAQQLENKARRIQSGWEAELRICVDEILPLTAFWPHVRSFYEINPDTHLTLSSEVLSGTWDALISRRADLVVGAAGTPPEMAHIVAKPVGTLRHLFAVAPRHPLAALPEPLTVDDLAPFRVAVISDTSRELPQRSVAVNAGQPTIAVPTLAAKLAAQCEGIAVGTLPECVAASAIREGKLVTREVHGLRTQTTCYLAWRDDEAGRALEWWVERLDSEDLISRLAHAA